jgi:hypothetical protein
VVEVLKGTPAERAGLKSGDVITRFEDKPVYDADDLVRAVQTNDGEVSITLYRQGSRRDARGRARTAVTAGDAPARWKGNAGAWTRPQLDSRLQLAEDKEKMKRELKELREELRELRKDIEDLKRD